MKRLKEKGKKNKAGLLLLQENTKAELKALKIKDFKSDLDEFHGKFDRVVRQVDTTGVNMDDGYLMWIFARGCSEHRDLKTRTGLVDVESLNSHHELPIATRP
jgi:hypothetical protein